jgi:hypothetical protein
MSADPSPRCATGSAASKSARYGNNPSPDVPRLHPAHFTLCQQPVGSLSDDCHLPMDKKQWFLPVDNFSGLLRVRNENAHREILLVFVRKERYTESIHMADRHNNNTLSYGFFKTAIL